MGCCTSSHSLKVISSRTLAHNWLTRTPLFLHLTHAQLDYLSAAFSSVTYEAGDVIAERGAADDTLCLVSAGSIGFIQPPSEDGQSQRRSLVALSAEGDELVTLPGQVGGSETEQVRRGSTASGHDASEAGSSVAGVDVAATSGGGAQPKLGKLSLLIRSRMKAHVEKIRSLGLETQSDAGSGGEGAGNDGLDSAARRAVRGTLKRKHNLAEVLNAKRVKPKSDDGLGMTTVVPTAQPRAEQPHVQPMMPLEEADDEESDAGGSNRTGTVISDGMSELDDTIRMRRRISEEHGAILTVKSAGAFFGHTIGESATHANKIVALDNTTLLAATHEQLLGIVGRDVQFREALLAGLGEGSKVEQYLSQLTLFNDIPREKLSVVASMLHFVPLDEEEVLFEEGDDNPEGNSLYILHTGTCQARTKKEPPVVLNEFHSGQFFGEIGLLINVPRTARIVATSRCLLMELKPDDFWSFVTLNTSPMLISNLTQLLKLRTADSFRRFKIPLFASVPADKYQLLGHNCRIMQLEANEVVFREDDVGSDFYLILHGRVLVTSAKKVDGKDEAHVICELSDGNYFGEAALLRQQTRNATITCITRTVLIALKLEDFAAFCDHVPGVREACEARLALYEIDMHTVLYDRDAQALFRRHLEREIAVENLDFWNAAREFMLKWRAAGFSKRRASMHDIGANLENNVLLRGEELGQSPQVKPKTLTEQSSSQLMDQLQRRRMCTEARRIVDKYVREDSPYWINLSGAVRDELVSLVDKAHACDPRIAALPDAPESICAESFDKAQHEVQDLMTRDPFRRFKQSSLFQDLVALLDAKRSSALPAQATSANPSPAASRSPSIQRSRSRASSRSNGSWTDKIREFNQSLLNDRSFGERSHSDRLEAPVPPGSAPNSPRQRSSRGSSSRTERMRRVLDMSKQSPS